MASSNTNDTNMKDDENSNKRKISMVSPTKPADPLERIDLMGDNSSIRSEMSTVSNTTLLSKGDKDEHMGNKEQDADNELAKNNAVAWSPAGGTKVRID